MPASLAVVILNWNGAELLRRFLPSVWEHSWEQAEVWVADNGSTDESLSLLAQDFPHVHVLPLDHNWGFAEGYNRAIATIEADWVLLLNSDVEVTPGWLIPLRQRMEAHADFEAWMPKIRSQPNKALFDYAGAAGGYWDALGYPFCRGRIFQQLENDRGQYDAPVQVGWASGAALLIRRKTYLDLGGLDARFFAHMEEIDLCWRLWNAGGKIGVEPRSVVFHLGGASLDAAHPRKTFLNFRNSLATLVKNSPSFWPGKVFARLCLDGLAGLQYLVQGKPAHTWAIVRAHFSFYAMLGHCLRQRTANPQAEVPMYSGSIVWQAYIRKRQSFEQLDWQPQGVFPKEL